MPNAVRESFKELFSDQEKAAAAATKALSAHEDAFFEAYRRLVPLQAWRMYLLPAKMNAESQEFFMEAQNDGLVSLLLARQGMWRPSLQSLRSVIENVLSSLYFRDHPVEYELWKCNRFRIGFAELRQYFETHPITGRQSRQVNGLDFLDDQYRILSKAVHGSGKGFRMTNGVEVPVLYGQQSSALGKWATNQKQVLLGINLLLVSFFADNLKGTSYANIRSTLGYVLNAAQRKKVKTALGINIPSPE